MLFSNSHAKSKALLFKKHANKNKTNAIQRGRNNSNISIAWLEEQHATMNQHVKQGHGLLKGGGSGALKKRFKRTKR